MIFERIVAPSTLTRTERKLRSFASLPNGWHYGKGRAISGDAIACAEKVYRALVIIGLSRTDAFPGADGEVQIAAYHGEHTVTVEVGSDLTLSLVHEVDDKECCAIDNVQLAAVKHALSNIADEIWGMSVLSTRSIGKLHEGALGTWHIGSLPVLGSPSLRSSAQNKQVA